MKHCLPRSRKFYPVGLMRAVTKRQLAVVCGLGPSLATHLEILQGHRDRIFLVAPVRVAMQLVDLEITPDVVVLQESGGLQYDLVEHKLSSEFIHTLKQRGVSLVTDLLAPQKIVQRFRRHLRVFYFGNSPFPDSVVLPNSNQSLFASIALAVRLDFRKIGLVGVDLGTHAFQAEFATLKAFRCFEEVSGYDFGSGPRKHGWKKASLRALLSSLPRASARISGRTSLAAWHSTAHIIRQNASRQRRAGTEIEALSNDAVAVADRCFRSIAPENVFRQLQRFHSIVENEWSQDPAKRQALEALETAYLTAFWRSPQPQLDPKRARRAAETKGILIFQELAERFRKAS